MVFLKEFPWDCEQALQAHQDIWVSSKDIREETALSIGTVSRRRNFIRISVYHSTRYLMINVITYKILELRLCEIGGIRVPGPVY